VFLVAATFSSDHFRERGIHMVVSLAISVVGYILLITVDLDNIGLTYFAIFMTTVGVSFSNLPFPSKASQYSRFMYVLIHGFLGVPNVADQQRMDRVQHSELKRPRLHERNADLYRQHRRPDL